MYTFLVISGIITVAICLLFKYTNIRSLFTKHDDYWPDEDYVKSKQKEIDKVKTDSPITNNSLIDIIDVYDKKEDSRTDYRSSQHSLTNFFLFIIAFYCAVQLIKEFIAFRLVYEVVGSLNETLQQLWFH